MPLLDFRDGSADCSVTAYSRFQSGRFVAPEDQNDNLIIYQEFNSYWKRQFRNLCKTDFKESKDVQQIEYGLKEKNKQTQNQKGPAVQQLLKTLCIHTHTPLL